MAKILNKDSHLLRWAASGGAAVLLLLFGALIFTAVPELLRAFKDLEIFVFGLSMVIVLIY